MHTNPLSKGEPIGWGAIKTHCTAMDSVAAHRRLNPSRAPQIETLGLKFSIEIENFKPGLRFSRLNMPEKGVGKSG